MSPQDKATTERHARTLRELVKRPENRVCADCKHNDPRWASWNIGVFLCIRCSGIHRGMGTHISKVKSIDLDAWTPEQMDNIQKWGNRLANLYWEAHLKPGHVPPDHKIESFIRSKYESRRWALDGPPPLDPGVLEGGQSAGEAATATATLPTPNPGPTPVRASQQIPPVRQPSAPTVTPALSTRHTQPHKLLSAQYARGQVTSQSTPTQVTSTPAPAPAPVPASENDLFSLDFHAPPVNATPATAPAPKKDTKEDILSLFGAQATPSPWSQAQTQTTQLQSQPFPPFSNAASGSSSTTNWNVGHNWNNPVPPVQSNVWGATPQQPPLFGSETEIWGGSTGGIAGASSGPFGSSASMRNTQTNKEDVFGDIWGSFK
jgi:stromal membrane-associated protein